MNWKNIKRSTEKKISQAKSWIKYQWTYNPEKCIIATSIVVPAITGIVKSISKSVVSSNEEHHRLLMDYDHSNGWWNELRRPLTSDDKKQILEYRNETGCSSTDALIHFNLLKK